MGKIFTILFLTVLFCSLKQKPPQFSFEKASVMPVGCGGHKYLLSPGGDGGIIIFGTSYQPGDTFLLNASANWTYMFFGDFHGTPTCPFVIMPSSEDTVVNAQAITLNNCTYGKLTGRRLVDTDTSSYLDSSRNFGIYVHDNLSGVAVAIQGKSKNVEVDMIKVYKLNYAVWCKNEVSCDTTLDYMGDWSWRLDSMNIHHVYAHNIGQDVVYAGSTGQLPTDRPITCGGVVKNYMPMALSNLRLHHFLIDSANRTGIQVGGHRYGSGSVRKNIVKNVGYEFNQQQGDGLAIGGMSGGLTLDSNIIRATFLYGILDFGAGWTNYITNNDIDSSGYLYINPAINMDSLAAATGMTNLGNHILGNTWSNPQSIIESTKQTVFARTKTTVISHNKLGANIGNANIYFVSFSIYPQDWTKNNIVCSNTKQDGTTPANITRFTYNSQAWPVYSTNCNYKPKTGIVYY